MKKIYRINQFINAPQIRLLSDDNKQIGILSRDVALALARERGIDLVMVAEHANPPVCRLIEFKKFKYQESKKERVAKRGIKHVDTKQIIYTPFIAENDFHTGLEKARKWLKDGDHVKIVVKFVGRQITKKEFGFKIMNKFAENSSEFAEMEREPKFEGKMLTAMFKPKVTR